MSLFIHNLDESINTNRWLSLLIDYTSFAIHIKEVCPYFKYMSLSIRIEEFVHTMIRDIIKQIKWVSS